MFVHCVIVCVPHLQHGRGAVHRACRGGHVQIVNTLVEEFGMSPNVRDNVSFLTVHKLMFSGCVMEDTKGMCLQIGLKKFNRATENCFSSHSK